MGNACILRHGAAVPCRKAQGRNTAALTDARLAMPYRRALAA